MNERKEELRKAGLKVTNPRVKILELLKKPENQHISAENLYKILIKSNEDIGLATVYRVLNQFEAAGILKKHYFDSGKSVFELGSKENHDHIVCLDCGKVIEFSDSIMSLLQEQIAERYSIKLVNHNLYLYGKCTKKEKCQAN